MQKVLETTGPAVKALYSAETSGDITVVNVSLVDAKGRFVPDACQELTLSIDGPGRILGAGNGDPAYLGPDNPGITDCRIFTISAFNGHAQFVLQGVNSDSTCRHIRVL